MERQCMTLWCKLLGTLVEAVLVRDDAAGAAVPGVPSGWKAVDCLGRDAGCFGKGCPFTTDGGDSPFGEVGEFPERTPEACDPLAEPGFEGEWG